MSENEEKHWYAARTRANQELAIRERLEEKKIEYYLPTRIVNRKLSDRIKKVEIPVISNIIFIKTSKNHAYELINIHGLKISYLQDFAARSILIVPEKQMNDFMRIMKLPPDDVDQHNENFEPGDKVRVIRGPLSGIEGEMIRLEGRTHVLLRLLDLIVVSVKIPKNYLEKI
ncbi:UpxY family transcription antiterminator [Bacteroides sp. 214]|uniref:UpxY family transcription antiterminator n=1 Tax=Bacteroides sp. 214 TaxID=2302935 RepID=UPI0013D6B7B0|nr:UpxY family transcription antiterminator [Bacteroides sp. 214]NDW13762.1 UpxY family transcription antiterminator [Bacteroides sp. 214]